MKKEKIDSRQKLFEMIQKLDKSFKPVLNEKMFYVEQYNQVLKNMINSTKNYIKERAVQYNDDYNKPYTMEIFEDELKIDIVRHGIEKDPEMIDFFEQQMNKYYPSQETVDEYSSSKFNEVIDVSSEYNPQVYKQKVDKIKAVIDGLFNDGEYDIIDTIFRLFVSRKASVPKKSDVNVVTEMLNKLYEKNKSKGII